MTQGVGAIRAVIFDLDGVIVRTDASHYAAWKSVADELGVPFDEQANAALRGVSRMESLERLLGARSDSYSPAVKADIAARKNERYVASLESLRPGDVLPGVHRAISALRERGIAIAIGSSSRNARTILERTGLSDTFDAVVDGDQIRHSKPDPEVFLRAASELGVPPTECLVVEDATAGVLAASRAGMRILAVGDAMSDTLADFRAVDLDAVDMAALLDSSASGHALT